MPRSCLRLILGIFRGEVGFTATILTTCNVNSALLPTITIVHTSRLYVTCADNTGRDHLAEDSTRQSHQEIAC